MIAVDMLAAAGHFLFRHRNAIFPFAVLLILLPGPPLFPHPLAAVIAGAVIAALGQFVRAATIGLRYVVRGGRGRRVYAADLVTEGSYACSRNPMYVGNILIGVGLAVASNSLSTVLVTVPAVLFIYASIVAAEEQFLRAKFGTAFEAYCRAVPRWIPRPGALHERSEAVSFRWRRVLVKEYGTPFGWVSVLSLTALYGMWRGGMWDEERSAVMTIEAVMVVTVLLWFVAWILKRSRLVVAD